MNDEIIYEDLYDGFGSDDFSFDDARRNSALAEDTFENYDPFAAQPGEGRRAQSEKLAESDLPALFGVDGPIAGKLSGYELRPTQLAMAEAVKDAILAGEHALVEAPTGTGKSIAYLIPALLSGQTVVVATANKSLQSQLYNKDVPFLREVLGEAIETVMVKGRSNYVCTHKWAQEDQAQRQIALYDQEEVQVTNLRQWLSTTESGDVDELPFLLSGDLRPRVVSFPDDCLQSDCAYFEDDCWVNLMRDRAANAQLLITNHHLLLNALQLGWGGQRILPPAAIYIVDEAHQLEQTATSVFETEVTDYTVEQLLLRQVLQEKLSEEELDSIRTQNLIVFQHVSHLSRDNSFRIEDELEQMARLSKTLSKLWQRLKDESPYRSDDGGDDKAQGDPSEERRHYELTLEAVSSAARKLMQVATDRHDENYVRYAVRLNDRRRVTIEIHAAPIDPAQLLGQYLFHAEENDEPVTRTVICTSATLATNHNFEHFKQRCGVHQAGEEHVLSTVFDFPKQSLLYQPPLPAYNYRNAGVYYDAVAAEIERLVEVSRGRALCLFTNWSGLQQVSDRLQDVENPVIWPVRAQGSAPRDALLAWFKGTPHSVLLATRSFWEGVDIPGDDLSLVVLDKMPFPTPGDPLHHARMKAIDEAGDSSFGQYMLPLMTLALKQGFGRLIRRTSDAGVVAILDERLSSKGYGRQARGDLPPAQFGRSFKDVHKFFQRTLASEAEFAVNVWAEVIESDADKPIYWRWQLLRLQDGKADSGDGFADALDSTAVGEIVAMAAALADLRQRIERAGRKTGDFAVEVRCSQEAAALADGRSVVEDWPAERGRWKAVTMLPMVQ